jgi:hypothetical protein
MREIFDFDQDQRLDPRLFLRHPRLPNELFSLLFQRLYNRDIRVIPCPALYPTWSPFSSNISSLQCRARTHLHPSLPQRSELPTIWPPVTRILRSNYSKRTSSARSMTGYPEHQSSTRNYEQSFPQETHQR